MFVRLLPHPHDVIAQLVWRHRITEEILAGDPELRRGPAALLVLIKPANLERPTAFCLHLDEFDWPVVGANATSTILIAFLGLRIAG